MNSLLTVGSVAFDQIETPFGKTDKILGGAGTYISLSASNFNIKNFVVSVVGYDFPNEYLNLLSSKNIDINGIEIKKDEKTFFWSGKYHQNMNVRDTLITELNSLASFNPVLPDEYKNVDVVVLGNLTPIIQRQVIEQLASRPKLILMDTMNYWMDIMFDELIKTIKLVDVIAINEDEVRQLAGEYNIISAAKKVIDLGPKFVIVKKGEHGAFIFSKNDLFYAPAYPLENVLDPTGAGDTFAGGFAGYLAQTNDFSFENMKNAIVVASSLASISVEGFGTSKIQNFEKSELLSRIKTFEKMTQFKFSESNIL